MTYINAEKFIADTENMKTVANAIDEILKCAVRRDEK